MKILQRITVHPMPPLKKAISRRNSRSGFALVISLSLMSFVLLLLLSMSTLVQVKNTSSRIQIQSLEAEHNALLGLQIALGELQKAAGPDQRVSANAEILSTSVGSRSKTVGIWSSADIPSESLSRGDLVQWLSSDAKAADGTVNLAYNTTNAPSTNLDNSVILVGAGSLLDANNDGIPDDLDEQVVVDVSNTVILQDNQTVGRYAWWIGDEGIKARANLSRTETRTDGPRATKQQAVLDASSFSVSQPSVLAGLGNIDFDANSSLIFSLPHLEILAGTNQAVDKQYFHDITFASAGVLSDVKNGGLKKDLSLAFEMNDTDFNGSEFASDGFDAYTAWSDGLVVQPVFTFNQGTYSGGANFSGTANGPVWHLLRDYYRIYHRMQTPMSDPTFTAQVFGPNYNHSTYSIDTDSDGYFQPGFLMAGGKAFSNSNQMPRNDEPSNVISWMRAHKDSPMIETGSKGDTLRARDGDVVPTMVSANYMPLMIRNVNELGIYFENAGSAYKVGTRSRNTFVLHNPYNVKLVHDDISMETRGFYTRTKFFQSGVGNGSVEILDDTGASTGNTWGQGTGVRSNLIKNRAVVESDTMDPGEIKAYEGAVSSGNNTYANEINTFTSNWHSTVNNQFFLRGTTVHHIANGTYKYVGRADSAHYNVSMVGTNFTGSQAEDRYVVNYLDFKTFMRDGTNTFPGGGLNNEIQDQWPLAYSFGSPIIGPGGSYGTAPASQKTAHEFRFPINDINYENIGDLVAQNSQLTENFLITDYTDPNAPLLTLTFDLKLKPTEYLTTSGQDARYPVYALTNPMAPVKDSRGFLPAGEFVDDTVGFPTFSPGWDISIGRGQSFFGIDYRLWGPSDGDMSNPAGGVDNATILELPTSPILSLGKLQHANVTPYDHMPALAISNSFASPYIARDQVYDIFQNRHGNDRIFYDVSYLINEALWDSYFFSSYSLPYDSGSDDYNESSTRVQDTFEAVFEDASSDSLPNPRMQLTLGTGEALADVKAKLFSSRNPAARGYVRAAENLLVAGAFNANSTSEDAWFAILAGARDQAIYQSGSGSATTPTSDTTPFSRLSQPTRAELTTLDIGSNEAWGGFRSLTDAQLQALATNIVAELKARADAQGTPFLSLSEFVNRKLSTDTTENFGLSGLLQSAIDKTNSTNAINNALDDTTSEITVASLNNNATGIFPEPTNLNRPNGGNSNAALSAPTYLLQADILQAIGSFLSVRSDCFKIRAYGQSTNSITGENAGEAWCEALVQRIPEPVQPQVGTTAAADPEYWSAQDASGSPTPLGRKFKVISLRWLSADEV